MDDNTNAAAVRARAGAIEAAGGFDPGQLSFTAAAKARDAYVEARAALLWMDEELADLDVLAAKKVAAWEVEDVLYEEESHSAARDSASSQTLAAALKAARTSRGLSIDDIAAQSGVPADVYAGIENLTYAIDVAQVIALARVLGLSAASLLDAGQRSSR